MSPVFSKVVKRFLKEFHEYQVVLGGAERARANWTYFKFALLQPRNCSPK